MYNSSPRPAGKIIRLMQNFGGLGEVKFHIAEVTSVDPFAIRITGDPFDIDMDSLVLSQHLLPHEQLVSVNGGPPQIHSFQEGYIKTGDDVIVVEHRDGQQYIVLDKAIY